MSVLKSLSSPLMVFLNMTSPPHLQFLYINPPCGLLYEMMILDITFVMLFALYDKIDYEKKTQN